LECGGLTPLSFDSSFDLSPYCDIPHKPKRQFYREPTSKQMISPQTQILEQKNSARD
jgi:hypothetical protein